MEIMECQSQQIGIAVTRKVACLKELLQAKYALQRAQNEIAPVQGLGSANIYNHIGDAYCDQISAIIELVKDLEPTGVDED